MKKLIIIIILLISATAMSATNWSGNTFTRDTLSSCPTATNESRCFAMDTKYWYIRSAGTWTVSRMDAVNIDNLVGSGQVNTVQAGTNITVDATDPANPIVSAQSQTSGLATTASVTAHTTITTSAHGGIVADTDVRLSDARTPLAHSQAFSTITGSVPLASAVSGSLPWVNISTSYPTFNQNTSGTAAGLSTILALASGGTNSTLSGCAGNDFVRMNAGKTALECAAIAGGGDMLKADNLSGLANYTTARNNLIGTTAGNALELVRVNAGATDLEYFPLVSASTLTCGTTDKFSAYNATSGVFTCTADVSGGGTPITGPGTSVDNEVVLFSSTTGSVLKRASTTGVPLLTAGVLSVATGTGAIYVKNGVASVQKTPVRVWATADQTFSSTTAAASTYLTMAVGIGSYTLNCFLPATNTTTSATRFALALPASSTVSFYTIRRTISATALVAPDNITAQWASTCTGCTAGVTTSVIAQTAPNEINGYFTTTAGGTATIYVADSTTGQANVVKKGAYCDFTAQ